MNELKPKFYQIIRKKGEGKERSPARSMDVCFISEMCVLLYLSTSPSPSS